MSPYLICALIGIVGLSAMAFTGLGRHGHHGHHGLPGHHGHASHPSARGSAAAWPWALTSPRLVFGVLVGFGTTGLLLHSVWGAPIVIGAALAGGVLFDRAIVGPLWNFLMRFASAPALTLESCIQDEVRAATGFDAEGQGVIVAEVDGQVVRVLGTLGPEDRARGVRVRTGDRLRIEDVDSRRNRCTVSFIGR